MKQFSIVYNKAQATYCFSATSNPLYTITDADYGKFNTAHT